MRLAVASVRAAPARPVVVVASRASAVPAGEAGPAAAARRWTHTGKHRTTIREPKVTSLPGAFVAAEAEKMGALTMDRTVLARRPVPASDREFKALRRAYKEQLSAMRSRYQAEWAERRARESAKLSELQAALSASRLQSRAARDAEKAARMAAHEARRKERSEVEHARRAIARRNVQNWLEQVDVRRQAWLDALESDAAHWITEDSIDERINEDLFATKYSWQFEEWYAQRARKTLASEVRRRAAASSSASAPAASDGASPLTDLEALDRMASSASSSSSASSLSSSLGAMDADADDAAWDSDGEAALAEEDISFARDSFDPMREATRDGIQLEELYFKRDTAGARALRDARLREYAGQHLDPASPHWLRDASGALIVDEGDRDVEERLIAAATERGNERLLRRVAQRKRERLERDFADVRAARVAAGLPADDLDEVLAAGGAGSERSGLSSGAGAGGLSGSSAEGGLLGATGAGAAAGSAAARSTAMGDLMDLMKNAASGGKPAEDKKPKKPTKAEEDEDWTKA